MSTWLVAPLLLPIVTLLVAGLVLLWRRALALPPPAALEPARFQRCLARAAHGDARLHERQIEAALREFEAAFCLIIVRADARLADQLPRHPTGLLSRLLSLADDLPPHRVRLLALAKVERLLTRRSAMQRAHLQRSERT